MARVLLLNGIAKTLVGEINKQKSWGQCKELYWIFLYPCKYVSPIIGFHIRKITPLKFKILPYEAFFFFFHLILWPPDVKSWLIGKHPDTGKNWGQEEKGLIEDKMVGWHHWLEGHEFEQMLGDREG